MTQRISTNLIVGLCVLLFFAEVGFAQKKNPTVYPYGGVPDKGPRVDGIIIGLSLNFKRPSVQWTSVPYEHKMDGIFAVKLIKSNYNRKGS